MNRIFVVSLILLVFFVISFLTNILGPIIPDIIQSFELSLGLAGFLPFAFFLAYGVMSIPSGILVERYQEKRVMMAAFVISSIGAFQFAMMPTFVVAMLSLFMIGVGMAMLQVAINPLLREAGGKENFAFNSVLGQLCFGAASFLSPQVYSYLVVSLSQQQEESSWLASLQSVVPQDMAWVSLYWVFAVVSLLMVIIISLFNLPKVEQSEEDQVGQLAIYRQLFSNRTVLMYFFAIACYVGTEQGVANWMSQYLSSYHGIDPQLEGADVISYFWGLLTVGCLLGLLLLKVLDSKVVLMTFTGLSMLTLLIALFGDLDTALIAFPLVGFFLSVMWSVIFSLALNSLSTHHGAVSGILCTGIVGGALVPLIIGNLAEIVGLQWAMVTLLLPLSYIFWVAYSAQPLIRNRTIWNKNVTPDTSIVNS
ncbi:MAG: MFS transporter [Colwellia sp.]|nr:MFS transporter [Colwellia sp.]